jgi:hypothetical protein
MRFCGGHSLCLICDRMRVVSYIDLHERLALADDLAGVDITPDDFAGDPKAEVALNPGGNHARKGRVAR